MRLFARMGALAGLVVAAGFALALPLSVAHRPQAEHVGQGEGRRHLFYADVVCRDSSGAVKWAEYRRPNLFHDEGEQALLSAYFDTDLAGFGAPPANLYIGLRSGTLAEADTLATITEVTGTGYARSAVETTTGFTLSQVTGDYRATSTSEVFTASGSWTAATALFVTTASTGTAGKLIASVALSTTRTLVSGDTLTVSTYVSLSE